jgi:hypothetical protein
MTTLREAIQTARQESNELPAGEIRRKLDNILNDETLTDGLCGWDIDHCYNEPEAFYEELKITPF